MKLTLKHDMKSDLTCPHVFAVFFFRMINSFPQDQLLPSNIELSEVWRTNIIDI